MTAVAQNFVDVMQRKVRVRLSGLSLILIATWLYAKWTRSRSSPDDPPMASHQTTTTTTAVATVPLSTSAGARDEALQQQNQSAAVRASSKGATADPTARPAHAQLLDLAACTRDAATSEPVSMEDVISGTAPRCVCLARLPRVASVTRANGCYPQHVIDLTLTLRIRFAKWRCLLVFPPLSRMPLVTWVKHDPSAPHMTLTLVVTKHRCPTNSCSAR